jgi:transposase
MALEGEGPQNEVARELGINPETLYRWVREFKTDPTQSFPGQGTLKERDKELEQLRRENARLKGELSFLKKVSAYFAKNPR